MHPIEKESYAIIQPLIDTIDLPAELIPLAARVLHATTDTDLARSLHCTKGAVDKVRTALLLEHPIITDVEMTRSGISRKLRDRAVCALSLLPSTASDEGDIFQRNDIFPSRSAAAMSLAASSYPRDALYVIGCAPTALDQLLDMMENDSVHPVGIIALPVGFVGAEQAKKRLVTIASAHGIPAITNSGPKGGSAATAACINAVAANAGVTPTVAANAGVTPTVAANAVTATDGVPGHSHAIDHRHGMLIIGHGTRSLDGVAQLKQFSADVQSAKPAIPVTYGLIEFADETGAPTLDQAVNALVVSGVNSIVGVPLVLLGAGHMKDDGPAILRNARLVYPGVHATYARNLGIHPLVLDAAESSAATAGAYESDAVVLVGRGSTDPDANSDLAKVARLLADGRGIGSKDQPRGMPAITPPGESPLGGLGMVEPAFVSLAPPSVSEALERCRTLGAENITVVPYFLFAGLLLDRIREQAAAWAAGRVGCNVTVAGELWPDSRIVRLVWLRYDEALRGDAAMNCDCCIYRVPLPGYISRIAIS